PGTSEHARKVAPIADVYARCMETNMSGVLSETDRRDERVGCQAQREVLSCLANPGHVLYQRAEQVSGWNEGSKCTYGGYSDLPEDVRYALASLALVWQMRLEKEGLVEAIESMEKQPESFHREFDKSHERIARAQKSLEENIERMAKTPGWQ